MLKFRRRSTTKTTKTSTIHAAPTTGADMSRDPNHPLRIRNLLDYPQLQAVMHTSDDVTHATNVRPIDSGRFNRRRLLEGAA